MGTQSDVQYEFNADGSRDASVIVETVDPGDEGIISTILTARGITSADAETVFGKHWAEVIAFVRRVATVTETELEVCRTNAEHVLGTDMWVKAHDNRVGSEQQHDRVAHGDAALAAVRSAVPPDERDTQVGQVMLAAAAAIATGDLMTTDGPFIPDDYTVLTRPAFDALSHRV